MKSPQLHSGPTDYTEPLSLPEINWHAAPKGCLEVHTSGDQHIRLRYGTITSGIGAGVQIVEIDNGPLQIVLLPTRGLSIWQVICDGVPFKWNSPIAGPVHPSFVPVFDPSGLGWLEGFDEFFVRCGLVSNGAPEFDSNNGWLYPLHGRIANLPAEKIWCEADERGVSMLGTVNERRLFFNSLQLQASLHVGFGSREIAIQDRVTNLAAIPTTTQMLYHINIGKPVLSGNAKLVAPAMQVAPRDQRAANEVDNWSGYASPTTGYSEAVSFFELASDDDGWTSVLLESNDQATGFGLSYQTDSLPCFTQWKNTAADADGYVTGLEPGTNFPNGRSFEEQHRRIVFLEPGESVQYDLRLCPLTGSESVARFRQRVQEISEAGLPVIHQSPKPTWTPG